MKYRSVNSGKRRTLIVLLALLLAAAAACAGAFSVRQSAYADGEQEEQTQDTPSENPTAAENPAKGVQGGAVEVTGYDFRAKVNKDHSYDIEENITVNIPDTLESIEFAIPSGNFRMSGLTVDDAAFSSKTGTDGSYVTIVDPGSLSKGRHTYRITYKIMEFADRDETGDVLYMNVMPPDWKQPVADLSVEVSFPEDFPMDELECYSGQLGVQDSENRISIERGSSKNVLRIFGKLIPENFGITLKADLADGYWEDALDGVWAIYAMILMMGAVVLALLVMWLIGGKDPKVKRRPETRPLDGVSAAEIGYIFNSRMDVRDIVRLILYFARSGYLRINEYEPKRYKLIRLKDPDGEEKLMRNAYGILFEDVYKGRALEMDQVGDRLVRMEDAIRDDVAAGFSSKEMQAYTPLSRAFRAAGIALVSIGFAICSALKYSYQYLPVNYPEAIITGVITAVILYLLCRADDTKYSSSGEAGRTEEVVLSILYAAVSLYTALGIARQTGQYAAAVLILVLAAAAVFLAVIMRARGKGNAVLMMKLRQLRRFIYHPTPKELLENYLEDNNYYYDMMLYALTFGAEESWAISFLTLDVPEPDWYVDSIEGHAYVNLREKPTTIDYAHDFRSFARTMEAAYHDAQRRRR